MAFALVDADPVVAVEVAGLAGADPVAVFAPGAFALVADLVGADLAAVVLAAVDPGVFGMAVFGFAALNPGVSGPVIFEVAVLVVLVGAGLHGAAGAVSYRLSPNFLN